MSRLIVPLVLILAASSANASDSTVDSKVGQTADGLAKAWNERSPEAMASFYSLKADNLTSAGVSTSGRKQIRKLYADALRSPTYAESKHEVIQKKNTTHHA